MAEFALPKNSKIRQGKRFAAKPGAKNVREFRVYRWSPDDGANPRIDTYQGTSPLMAAAGVNWVLAQTWTEGPDQLLDAVKLCVQLGMDVGLNKVRQAAITREIIEVVSGAESL